MYRDRTLENRFAGGRFEIMLFIEVEKLEFLGGYIEIMLFIEVEKLEFLGGHNEIMLIIENENLELDRSAAILKLCLI